jgi:hypothetical protein
MRINLPHHIDCTYKLCERGFLAFGLPITNEGFNGVIVINEYLSKYPYAIPINPKQLKKFQNI